MSITEKENELFLNALLKLHMQGKVLRTNKTTSISALELLAI